MMSENEKEYIKFQQSLEEADSAHKLGDLESESGYGNE